MCKRFCVGVVAVDIYIVFFFRQMMISKPLRLPPALLHSLRRKRQPDPGEERIKAMKEDSRMN